MNDAHQVWFDRDAGPLVRPYAAVGGGADALRRQHELDLATMLISARSDHPLPGAGSAYEEIMRLCGLPRSVVELSAATGLSLFATKSLAADLIETGHLTRGGQTVVGADLAVMHAVLRGLRGL